MCVDRSGAAGSGGFDPERCPLLQGLDHETAERLAATDPRIRACRAAAEAGRLDVETCVTKAGRRGGGRAASRAA